jgi:hypothetical protein
MTKLIEKDSIIKNLPREFSNSELLIFDSMRFAFEIIDHSYSQLNKSLLEISYDKPNRNTPAIFGYAWSIIDNAVKVANICKQLPWENESEIVGHLHYLKEFRNTHQHLDERINESLLATESPFFGVISWVYKYPDSSDFDLFQLVSGTLIFGPNAKQTVPDLSNSDNELNTIRIHTVNRKGELIETDLDETIINLKKLVTELERRLKLFCEEKNINPLNWKARQDIVLRIKPERPKKE